MREGWWVLLRVDSGLPAHGKEWSYADPFGPTAAADVLK